MLLIYTPRATPRLIYIFDFIFKDLLGREYHLTHDIVSFRHSDNPKINYSEQPLDDEIFFCASTLLFEKGIRHQDLSVFEWENSKAFFATHPKYIFPFDPFAASFYLLSRYEEYLPHEKDSYGRFDVKASLSWQKNFLQKPLINIWAQKIQKALLQRFPKMEFKQTHYKYISTIDIDNAYAFKLKG